MWKFKMLSVLFLNLLTADFLSAGLQDNLPEPYKSAQLYPFDPRGWYNNGNHLEELIKQYSVTNIIEVGSWLGASTRHMASLLPDDGKIYAVDHWQGSVEHQPGNWAWDKVLPFLYDQFLSNVIHTELTDKIVPIRLGSLQAAEYFKNNLNSFKPDLIYIDASHDDESVYADLKAWYPFVRGHGILCGDDWWWVHVAVERFANENHLRIENDQIFWRLIER